MKSIKWYGYFHGPNKENFGAAYQSGYDRAGGICDCGVVGDSAGGAGTPCAGYPPH